MRRNDSPGYDEFHNADLLGRNIPAAHTLTGADDHIKYTRRIMLTGGAGFIGSVFVKKLVLNYPEYFILVVDKLDYCSSLNNLQPFLTDSDKTRCLHEGSSASFNPAFPNFAYLNADIIDSQAMEAALVEYRINTIIHLAAQTHVDKSFGESIDFTRNNVLGTHVLLEAARKHFGSLEKKSTVQHTTATNGSSSESLEPEPRFIFVSTDEVYGEVLFDKADSQEDAPLAPSNPYSATKAAAECMAQAYHKSFRLPVIITRSNNVYGPSQYPEKIFPKFIMNLLREQDPTLFDSTGSFGPSGKCYIHGSGHHWRTYLYVTDAANALDVVLQRGEVGQVYNIGGGEELNNIELAQLLVHRMVKGEKVSEQCHLSSCQGHAESQQFLAAKSNGHFCLGHRNGFKRDRDPWATAGEAQAHLNDCIDCSSRIEFVEDRAFNDLRYAVDSSKLQALGWEAKVDFNHGIEKTSKDFFLC
ncbi:hypothetical protein BG004_003538 [Podila humilis]|nr:hypothetical protein BG004_003538 [Podila humilis]